MTQFLFPANQCELKETVVERLDSDLDTNIKPLLDDSGRMSPPATTTFSTPLRSSQSLRHGSHRTSPLPAGASGAYRDSLKTSKDTHSQCPLPLSSGSSPATDSRLISSQHQSDPMNSTMIDDDSKSMSDLSVSGGAASCSNVSCVSMATTVADSAFQEGLAQLDANIARLQESLKSSRFASL